MKQHTEGRIIESIIRELKSAIERFDNIKERIDKFPRRPQLFSFMFQYIKRSDLRRLKRIIKDLNAHGDSVENILADLEKGYEDYLISHFR